MMKRRKNKQSQNRRDNVWGYVDSTKEKKFQANENAKKKFSNKRNRIAGHDYTVFTGIFCIFMKITTFVAKINSKKSELSVGTYLFEWN